MSISSLANQTATVKRPTTTAGAIGGQVKTWTTVYASIPVSHQPANGDTVEEFGKLGMQVSHRTYTDVPVDLLAGDVLTIDGDATHSYLIQSFRDFGGRGRAYCIYSLLKKEA